MNKLQKILFGGSLMASLYGCGPAEDRDFRYSTVPEADSMCVNLSYMTGSRTTGYWIEIYSDTMNVGDHQIRYAEYPRLDARDNNGDGIVDQIFLYGPRAEKLEKLACVEKINEIYHSLKFKKSDSTKVSY